MAIDSSSMRRSALSARLSLISTMSKACSPSAAAGVRRALAIALREVALGTLFQPADGGNHDPHALR